MLLLSVRVELADPGCLMHVTALERLIGRPGDVFRLDASFAFWSASHYMFWSASSLHGMPQ